MGIDGSNAYIQSWSRTLYLNSQGNNTQVGSNLNVSGTINAAGNISVNAGSFYDISHTAVANPANECHNASTGQIGWCGSDRRLKENIRYMDGGGLDMIRQLKPATFDWIGGFKDNHGFIAQDVAPLIPDATPMDSNGYYAFNVDRLVPYIVRAVQELDQKLVLIGDTSNNLTAMQAQIDSYGDIINTLQNQDTAESQTAFIDELTGGRIEAVDLEVTGNFNLKGQSIESFIADQLDGYAALGSGTSSISAELQDSIIALQNNDIALQFDVDNLKGQMASMSSRFESLESLAATAASTSALLEQLLASPLFASDSAGLNLEGGFVDTLAVSDSLIVTGETTVTDLGVTGTITAGLMNINGIEGAINTIGTPLKLQNLGVSGIDILDGKITIDTSGNIRTEGTITAQEIEVQKVSVPVDDAQSGVLSSSAGSVTIEAGETQIDVSTTALTSDSLIFVTPDGRAVAAGTKRKDADTFTVILQSAQPVDVKINWWIIN